MNDSSVAPPSRFIGRASWAILGSSVLLAVLGALLSPGQVPVLFDGNGIPERYGSPLFLFSMPAIIGACMLGSESVIRRLSSTHRNVPASATERSRTPTFQVIASMLHVLQAEMATFAFYNVAIVLMQRARSLPAVLVVLVIGVIGTIAYFVKEAVRM